MTCSDCGEAVEACPIGPHLHHVAVPTRPHFPRIETTA